MKINTIQWATLAHSQCFSIFWKLGVWQVLIDVLGDQSVTEEIINGKTEISK